MGKSKRKKNNQNKIMTALSAVFFAVFAVCTFFTVKNLSGASPAQSSPVPEVDIAQEEKFLNIKEKNDNTSEKLLGDLAVRTGLVEYKPDMREELKPLYAYNSDTIGWLKIPNTSIDTVVVQNDSDDGHTGSYKYLKNDFYGNFTKYGNLFLDYRCKKYDLSTNTIIYGHTTEDGQQVFYDLNKYTDPEFFKQNPIIEYSTLYNNYKWKVYAVFATTTEAADDAGYIFNYIYPAMGVNSMSGYIDQVNQRALYVTGVDIQPTDKVLTLSTCSYLFHVGGQRITARLVVVARLLRGGESEEIDASLVQDHPDYRRPQRWYSIMGRENPYSGRSGWKPSTD